MTSGYTEEGAIAFLESLGYRVVPGTDDTVERYPLDFLKERLCYDDMILQEPMEKDTIDAFFHYLHNAVNTAKSTLRVNGEDKPGNVVIAVLLKLGYYDFLYAVGKYRQNTRKINNHGAYILTLLYNARAQNEADITNRVQHDRYNPI